MQGFHRCQKKIFDKKGFPIFSSVWLQSLQELQNNTALYADYKATDGFMQQNFNTRMYVTELDYFPLKYRSTSFITF